MSSLSTSWYHIRRSPYQAFAAIFIILQTFFVASVFSFVLYGSAHVISYFESLPQATAFFNSDAKDENIQALEAQLRQTGEISKMHFVSKQEALQIYQNMFKNDPLLLEFVTADVLPASLEISTAHLDDLANITKLLKNSSFVKEVVFPQDVVSNLTRWTSALRKIGTALTALLAVDSMLLMIIIIGIKISQRRDEIEIMRLIGASSWYIRWPFLFEGMIYGVVGAFFGWVAASLVLFYAMPFVQAFIGPAFSFSPILLVELFGVEFFLALFLGMASSFLAVLRYLR